MARRPRGSTPRCSRGASCPGPIWSIPVLWTPNSALRVSRNRGAVPFRQHLLPGPAHLSVGRRGDDPWLLLPRFEVGCWRVGRPHAARMGSTRSSATSLSAKHVRVHRTRPAGGALQATASSCAAWTPSRLRYGRPVGRWRAHAASRPCSTQVERTRWTVAALVSQASAISAPGQRRPPTATSAFSRSWAWSRVTAAAGPVFPRAHSCSRASGASRTTALCLRMLRCGLLTTRRTDSLRACQVSSVEALG